MNAPVLQRGAGAAMAFGGLVWLLWPGHAASPSLLHAGLMAMAGVGWGVYSLAGRGTRDALGATATNFLIAALLAVVGFAALTFLQNGSGLANATLFGWAMAILSGAVTSGLGYALWYTVLPQLRGSTSAVVQLTVPVIAMVGGSLLLSEVVGLRLLIAALVVLGGVLIAVTSRR